MTEILGKKGKLADLIIPCGERKYQLARVLSSLPVVNIWAQLFKALLA